MDAENSPFLKLSIEESIQAVKDGAEGAEVVQMEMKEPEGSGQ
jgi:hypothetical protein